MSASAVLRILSAGGGVTLQDAGRRGYMRYGITPAGPMDPLAHAAANRALGNPPGATAIEVGLGGLALAVEGAPLDLAFAGGGFRIACDGQSLPAAGALTLRPGAELAVRPGSAGAWCYLAVGGRFALAPALGSHATHSRSGLGGLDGRALGAGDDLAVAEARAAIGEPVALVAPWLDRPPGTIRVVLGPQDDHFAPREVEAFLARDWRVSARGDRMACFLDGTPLRHAGGHDIVSDGIVHGAIQVPGQGLPIVLMADRQPTGGYPKIATVIGPDLGRLAQAQAGTPLRFRAVGVDEAVEARRAEAAALGAPPVLEPVIRRTFSAEFLLGCNLIDGVVG